MSTYHFILKVTRKKIKQYYYFNLKLCVFYAIIHLYK